MYSVRMTVNCRRQQNVRDKEMNGKRVNANKQHSKQVQMKENKVRERESKNVVL